MSELKLADLGEGMHEAEVVEWLVNVGDTVKLDQTVVKVETDKAIVEIPAPVAGRVSEIRVPNGQTARVGDVLVVFDAPAASSNGDLRHPQEAHPRPQLQPMRPRHQLLLPQRKPQHQKCACWPLPPCANWPLSLVLISNRSRPPTLTGVSPWMMSKPLPKKQNRLLFPRQPL